MLRRATSITDDFGIAFRRFEQGHLLHGTLSTYVARPQLPASSWAETYPFPDRSLSLCSGGIAPEPEPPFAIILDQTCDVHKTSIPFVHVAPVWNGARMYGRRDIDKILARKDFLYLYALTAADLTDHLTEKEFDEQRRTPSANDWAWIADLRVQIPLDKGVLLERNPIAAFGAPEERIHFGRELGRRRDRPAVPTVVGGEVQQALTRAVAESPDVLERVEFRYAVDSWASPSSVGLILITPADAENRDEVEAAIAPILGGVTEATGIPCFVLSCGSMSQVSAQDFDRSEPLDIDLGSAD